MIAPLEAFLLRCGVGEFVALECSQATKWFLKWSGVSRMLKRECQIAERSTVDLYLTCSGVLSTETLSGDLTE